MFTHRLWLGVLALLVTSVSAVNQEQPKTIKHTAAKLTSPASGKEMYVSYCAVCHGENGKGQGPAADALKMPPSDLTMLAQKNGGKFPAMQVSSAIRGDSKVGAHGSKEMPIWGPVFWQMAQGHTGDYEQRISNLTKYVESLQGK